MENEAEKSAMLLNFPYKSETARNRKAKQRETVWPRGIRLYAVPSRPKRPHAVQWRVDGEAKTKTFKTVEAQETFARSLAGDLKQGGVAALRLDESEAREWRAFRADIGNAPLASVLACWREYGGNSES